MKEWELKIGRPEGRTLQVTPNADIAGTLGDINA
jgi:hypothetical protein